jgi:hypothetical protein
MAVRVLKEDLVLETLLAQKYQYQLSKYPIVQKFDIYVTSQHSRT